MTDYADNGLRKKLKKAVKKVVHAPAKIVKQVAKVPKKIVKEASHLIVKYQSSSSPKPIEISSVRSSTQTASFEATEPVDIAGSITSQFSIPAQQLTSYLGSAKFTSSSKRVFHNFAMDIDNQNLRRRPGKYISHIVKVNRVGNNFQISVGEVETSCDVTAEIIESSGKKYLGGLSHSSHSKNIWRPLLADELSKVFETVQNFAADEIRKLY